MIKEVKLSRYCQNFGGYLPLPLGYIHVLNHEFLKVFSETSLTIFIRSHLGPSVERMLTIWSTLASMTQLDVPATGDEEVEGLTPARLATFFRED